MLNLLSEATFGKTSHVFKYEGQHEAWVDRKLNVIGSGFMHNRYFADMMHVHVAALFDDPDLDGQPRVVADMGCGDGTLLKTIYLYVKAETLRGKHLERCAVCHIPCCVYWTPVDVCRQAPASACATDSAADLRLARPRLALSARAASPLSALAQVPPDHVRSRLQHCVMR